MIYLDTHVVVWFYAENKKRFSEKAMQIMNQNDWLISPIVRLELQYLHEISRINFEAETIISELENKTTLKVCNKPFDQVIQKAAMQAWTRDPFDRILTAQASLGNTILVTADHHIQQNYSFAYW